MFVDRASKRSTVSATASVTPIKLKKKAEGSYTVTKKTFNFDFSGTNPKRKKEKTLTFCLKSNHPRVKVCRANCGSHITHEDKLIVRTVGLHERTESNGTLRKKTSDVYLHFLEACVKDYVENFRHKQIIVPPSTAKGLSGDEKAYPCTFGIKF